MASPCCSGTFTRIVRNGSTEEFESIPYVCTLLSSSMWTYYGINKPGELLIATINGFGVVLEAIYIALFLVYAPKRIRVKTGILVAILDVGFFVAAVLITRLAIRGSEGLAGFGFLAAGLNIVMYSSPLAAMVPNGVGFILGAVQLILYAIYRNAKPAKIESKGLEEGLLDHHLYHSPTSTSQVH